MSTRRQQNIEDDSFVIYIIRRPGETAAVVPLDRVPPPPPVRRALVPVAVPQRAPVPATVSDGRGQRAPFAGRSVGQRFV